MFGKSTAPIPGAQRVSSAASQLKVLMIHGYTQNSSLFRAKTGALEKSLSKAFPAAPARGYLPAYPGGVQLFYITAPHRLRPADIPGFDAQNGDDAPEAYGWFRKDDTSLRYAGLLDGLSLIATTLKEEGPFTGVIGFSQGAAVAAMVASLLEPGRSAAFAAAESKGGMPYPTSFLTSEGTAVIHPPLKFAVAYSGFWAPNERYRAFYEPRILTRILHFIGSLDSVVSEERSLDLVQACGESEEDRKRSVVFHPGGHFVPCQKQWLGVLAGWVVDILKEEKPAETL